MSGGKATPAPLCGSEEQTKWAHLEFEDGQTVPIKNSVSTSFYIGREPSANQHQHQFFHTADNVWRRVSAKHCHILRLDTAGSATLSDTSTNGTWINDEKLHQSSKDLRDGDKVKLYNARGEPTIPCAIFTFRSGAHLHRASAIVTLKGKVQTKPNDSGAKQPHLTDPASLQDKSAGKRPEGTGTTEKGKQRAAQQKRTRTTSQATTTQSALLDPDAFATALRAVPPDDWCRTWAAGRTIILRRTSKRVKEVMDKMRPPAFVCLSRSFLANVAPEAVPRKMKRIPEQLSLIPSWCRITRLELPACAMRGGNIEKLARVLAQCPVLAHLNLSGNLIRDEGAEILSGVMAQCPALAHLNLGENDIGPAGAEILAGGLGQCAALSHLDLSRNRIGACRQSLSSPSGAESLARVLVQCTALAHLNISCNFTFEQAGAKSLAGVLGQCRDLAHLDLRNNAIGSDGAGSLARVLGQCRALAHLNLSGNVIEADGAERLAGVLAQCAALAHLNLGDNGIGAAGAQRLSGVLGQCRALAHLNLYNNDIEAAGAESLAGVLGQCAALAHLDLSYNGIGAAGAESLAEVLGQCHALAHLDLRNNAIGSDGAGSLARVLGQCRALAHLNLSGNVIEADGAERLAGVLAQCAALAHLDLSSNYIPAAGGGRLRASWRAQAFGLVLTAGRSSY